MRDEAQSAAAVDRSAPPVVRPQPIRTDGTNAFARHSMEVRVPGIIMEVVERNADLTRPVKDRLWKLHDALSHDDEMVLFDPPSPDYDLWHRLFADHRAETWLDTEWFFSEMYSYRCVVDAVGYWATMRDPFRPMKEDELGSDALWTLLDETLQIPGTREERLAALLKQSLWGNRIDLSLSSVASQGVGASDEHLLSDDVSAAVEHLLRAEAGDVHVIMDNAGTEEALDFVVADLLLSQDLARRVVLHVKMHPVLVSDVIVDDVHALLDRMAFSSTRIRALGARIAASIDTGRLAVVPDFFWNTAGRIWQIPYRISQPFSKAAIVIVKGDVNYRRLTNDAFWPPGVSFERALQDVRFPILALRTLKSDTLLGVDESTCRRLDATHPSWRTDGMHGVAQFYPGPHP